MHNSDIIEVLPDNQPQDRVRRPGLLAPGYYLALPRRHRGKQQRNPQYVAPALVGPVQSEAAARLLKVSCAYLGLDAAETGAMRSEPGDEARGGSSRLRTPSAPNGVIQARVV